MVALNSNTPPDDCTSLNTIFLIDLVNENNHYDVLENPNIDLDFQIKNLLLSTLLEINLLEVEPLEDYNIRVHLKDSFLFRYAPRRISVMEKKELNNITDELLKRNIIKPSILPYCSRAVLVNKRNRKKCIDLKCLLTKEFFLRNIPFQLSKIR